MKSGPKPLEPIIRFRKKWKLSNEHIYNGTHCWEWTAYLDKDGYGRFRDKNQLYVKSHRWSYEHYREPIPDGLEIDHLCRNRACCNPTHLEPVTCAENIRRGNTGKNQEKNIAIQRAKTHCPQGHAYSTENTRIYRGFRHCRSVRPR